MQISSPTHIFFDWGDTVMVDNPAFSSPMVEWPQVHAIPGIEPVLRFLKTNKRTIVLATSADASDESQICAALARVGLANYFDRIYCFKNAHLAKSEAFYRYLLENIGITASQALMIGDSFEKDVLSANQAGIQAVWFNKRTSENRQDSLYTTVHSMEELQNFLAAGIS